jgi:nicastrin
MRATYNEEIWTMNDSNAGQQNVAKISLKMEAEGGNSTSCLASNTCVPLGGYSSIAALPPLGISDADNNNEEDGPNSLPALLVIAAVDTASFFHGEEQAADAPLSGLIAMLAAARVLGKHPSMQSNSSVNIKRRIYFAAMVGEPWDLMGSKRLLWEASQPGTNISTILSLDRIDSIIDVGQIGRAGDTDKQQKVRRVELFTHANPSSASSPTTQSILEAFQKAATQVTSTDNDNGTVISVFPSTVTTELPPSSTSAFLRVLPQDTPTVALTEFDAAFINPYFTSQYDTVDQVSNTTMAATASVLIRTLYDLALLDNNNNNNNNNNSTGGKDAFPPPTPLVVNETFVLETVEELSGCLMTSNPGLYCSLSTDLITPAYGPVPSHYVGILRWPTSDPQNPDPNSKKDAERFIWNYLAFATSGTDPSINNNENKGDGDRDGDVMLCSPYNTTACSVGKVCAGARDLPSPQGMGLCLRATVQYVASYSTSLRYVNSTWQTTDKAEEWEVEYGWPQPDPMWTESNWPTGVPSVEMYLNESESVDVAVLIAGIVVTVVSGLMAGVLIAAYRKRMKQD